MTAQSPDRQATRYAIDVKHSTIEFSVRHLMISKVRGRFAAFEGSIETAAGGDLPTSAEVTIETGSIDTREAQRDAHLKSADFFDAEKFPTLSFRSWRVEGTSDEFTIHGELTMHGVTKSISLTGTFEGRGADPWGGQRVGYSGHTKINRKDFGLNWNQALETGGVMVGEEIRIEINIEAVAQG